MRHTHIEITDELQHFQEHLEPVCDWVDCVESQTVVAMHKVAACMDRVLLILTNSFFCIMTTIKFLSMFLVCFSNCPSGWHT